MLWGRGRRRRGGGGAGGGGGGVVLVPSDNALIGLLWLMIGGAGNVWT